MPGQGNPLCCVVVLYVGVGSEGRMLLAWLSPCFQSLPLLPESEWCPSRCCPGADSHVGGIVYVLGSHGPLQRTLLRDWQFLPLLQPPQVFTARGSQALFSQCWNPELHGLSCSPVVLPSFYPHVNVGLPRSPATAWLRDLFTSAACLCPSYWSG